MNNNRTSPLAVGEEKKEKRSQKRNKRRKEMIRNVGHEGKRIREGFGGKGDADLRLGFCKHLFGWNYWFFGIYFNKVVMHERSSKREQQSWKGSNLGFVVWC